MNKINLKELEELVKISVNKKWNHGLKNRDQTILTLIQALRIQNGALRFYGEKSEPDYVGANDDKSPKCVMRAPWDNGDKASKAFTQVASLVEVGE